MLEMMVSGMKAGKIMVSRPVGQMTYSTGGKFNFTVPKDVVSICVACIGAALTNKGLPGYEPDGEGDLGLAGGGSMYMNNIAVTPGQVIPIQVGQIGWISGTSDIYNHITMSKFLGMSVGYADIKQTPTGATAFNGGQGGYSLASRIIIGGSAASLTQGGQYGTATIDTNYASARKPGGWDKDATIYTTPYAGEPLALYGAGGIKNNTTWLSWPQGGLVRIIWGSGRSFPSNFITNQTPRPAIWS